MSGPHRFGRFELNVATRQLFADGGQVTLGARAFDVLVALVERRERMVPKDELLQIAWPGVVVEENNLDVQIGALRKALGAGAIETVRGRGYRFTLDLESDRTEIPSTPRGGATNGVPEPSRLSAIMAADAAGYSRLMAGDERATMAALDAARAVFRRRIEANHGRVIDMAGDSVLAVFQTAAGAVSAALAIQEELQSAPSSEPEERRMCFRIGLHLGDVIQKGDGTVYGDGVNIAARLQAKAPPGGICASQTVYHTVKGKLPIRARLLGPETFKNIAEPVPIWEVMPDNAPHSEEPAAKVETDFAKPPSRSRQTIWISGAAIAVIAVLAIAGAWNWTRSTASPKARWPDAKSIAVLPFTNMSEDKSTGYFADGVHEDLLTQLGLLGELKVVSRTSVAEYRDSKKNVRQIGAELGVESLVEGSVRRAGNQVRVTAQLVDVRADKQLWARSYDRELKDIFTIQSELATEIARALKVSLSPQDQTRIAKRPTDNLEAYDLFLRHQEVLNQSMGTWRVTIKERIALLSRTVELDPKFALAWARLAADHARAYRFGVDRSADRRRQAREAMDRAQALAPMDTQVEIEAGSYYLNALDDLERATKSFENVLKSAPNNIESLVGLAAVRSRQLRYADTVALLERAQAVDGRNARVLAALSDYYRFHRHYDRVLALRQQLINLRPGDIDLQTSYHLVEYWRSGSWDAYDRWRSTVPKDASLKSAYVWNTDLERASARRDFVEVLRLIEIVPEDRASLQDSSSVADRTADRAIVLRAKGDRAESHGTARQALRLIENELRSTPDSDKMWLAKAWMHALLGERKMAFSAHARAVAVSEQRYGKREADFAYRQILGLYAVLGDRAEALTELERQLPLPYSWPHLFRIDPALVPLWDDPQFQALLDNPKNNAPLPIVNRDPPWLGK